MDRFVFAVILSWGWRRRGLAFAAGALSSLAQPPFFAFLILWITFPVLVWLLDGAVTQTRSGRVRRLAPAFSVGWWFGFGYFLSGLWWVGAAFLVEAETFGWLMPLAVVGLPAGLALFWGLGAAAAQLLWSEDPRRIFALAAGLGGAEWLRGHILSGFPWNSIGYSLTAGDALMQSASLFGLDGLNVLAVLIFAAPAALAPRTGETRSFFLPALSVFALAGLALFGIARLANASSDFVPETIIRIVQPSLDQLQKWDPENKDEVLETYYRLSAPEGDPLTPNTVPVWPESAFPFPLTQQPGVLAAIAELLPAGTVLVTGAYRVERLKSEPPRIFNAVYTISDDGTVLEAYDKVHLVPFGEYLPAEKWLRQAGLRQLVQSGFSPGPPRRSLTLPSGTQFAPLICYEAIFPGAVLPGGSRPDFLLNVTNDGWFGRTLGPYQHFHQARVRAVEEGIPLVRAANTGISAIVNGYGSILASSRLYDKTTIEARLPNRVGPPFYARQGNLILVLLIGVCIFSVATRFFALRPAIN